MLYIFDWDGTLVDSAGKIVAAMSAAITEVGLPGRGEAQIRHIIGLGLPEAIHALFPELAAERDGNVLSEMLRQRYSWHFLNDPLRPEFFPDVPWVLETLAARGHRLAVATGKSRRGLDRALAEMGATGWFHATRCADETRSKPDPTMLLQLMDDCVVGRAEAVMVGDTTYDLHMADRAGIKAVGVSYGAHDRESLAGCRPMAILDALDELLHLEFRSDVPATASNRVA